MFKTRFYAFCLAVFIGLTSTAAMAQSISDRVDFAHRRIEHGIRSGQLTREEAYRLKGEFHHILEDERRMAADGRLDHRERERLNHELDRLERHISHLKHNEERR
jgi:hypothetical protein